MVDGFFIQEFVRTSRTFPLFTDNRHRTNSNITLGVEYLDGNAIGLLRQHTGDPNRAALFSSVSNLDEYSWTRNSTEQA